MPNLTRATPLLALAIALAGLIGGCTTNPATGKKQYIVISPAEEVQIGTDAAPQFISQNGGEIPSDTLRSYVTQVGSQLAAVSERPDLPWEFHTLNSSQINAFALPGGKVFMSRGLLEKMDNEAQLAGVLGHEVGHVTAKHVNDRMVQAIGWGIIGAGIGIAGQVAEEDWLKVLGVGVGVGGGVYQLSFSRGQELESDELGVRYMTRAGYNPYGQVQVMRILAEASGNPNASDFFSTHPNPGRRIRDLEAHIADRYPDHAVPGKYTFNPEAFKANVLDELAKLPPAPDAKKAGD